MRFNAQFFKGKKDGKGSKTQIIKKEIYLIFRTRRRFERAKQSLFVISLFTISLPSLSRRVVIADCLAQLLDRNH
jgi:hypothetical protein